MHRHDSGFFSATLRPLKIRLRTVAVGALLAMAPVLAQAQVRVMSYNIHSAVGMDGQKNVAAIADAIKKADPDIVGLQEIADQAMAKKIGRLAGMHVVFGPSLGKMNGYGDAILSKHPFKYQGNYAIPSASDSRYEVMSVLVDFSDTSKDIGKLRLINTHFDWLRTPGSTQARLATVDELEEVFFKEPPPASVTLTLLTGDFNSVPDSDVVRKLEKYGWINSSAGGTYKTISSVHPTKQIDYVFYRTRRNWKVSSFHVMYGTLSSDHLPVVADFDTGKP